MFHGLQTTWQVACSCAHPNMYPNTPTSRDSLLVWEPDFVIERLRVRIPAGTTGEFSSPELTLCVDSYSVSVPPPCYSNGHVKKIYKKPAILHKLQMEGPTKSEWADYAAVQAWCWNLSGNKLTRNLAGNIRQQSSQLAEPLWTDPRLKSGISVLELTSTSKEEKKKKRKKGAGGECMVEHSPQNPRKRGKSHNHHHHH